MTITLASDPSDTFIYDAIERLALICKTFTDPTGQAISASDVFWDPSNIFPRFYLKFAGSPNADVQAVAGAPVYEDNLQFIMRFLMGTVQSGYLSQQERHLNKMVFQIMRRFRFTPMLNHPTDGTPLRYLIKPGARITSVPTGSKGIKFEDSGPLYVGADFLITMTIRTEVGRYS